MYERAKERGRGSRKERVDLVCCGRAARLVAGYRQLVVIAVPARAHKKDDYIHIHMQESEAKTLKELRERSVRLWTPLSRIQERRPLALTGLTQHTTAVHTGRVVAAAHETAFFPCPLTSTFDKKGFAFSHPGPFSKTGFALSHPDYRYSCLATAVQLTTGEKTYPCGGSQVVAVSLVKYYPFPGGKLQAGYIDIILDNITTWAHKKQSRGARNLPQKIQSV